MAIATGGWRRSARFKLECAGIPHEGLGAAFADDAHPREEIIRIATERAASRSGAEIDALGRRLYVGDGLWDLKAAGSLGIDFLGIAEGDRASLLREAGAPCVLPDFSDLDEVMGALGES